MGFSGTVNLLWFLGKSLLGGGESSFKRLSIDEIMVAGDGVDKRSGEGAIEGERRALRHAILDEESSAELRHVPHGLVAEVSAAAFRSGISELAGQVRNEDIWTNKISAYHPSTT